MPAPELKRGPAGPLFTTPVYPSLVIDAPAAVAAIAVVLGVITREVGDELEPLRLTTAGVHENAAVVTDAAESVADAILVAVLALDVVVKDVVTLHYLLLSSVLYFLQAISSLGQLAHHDRTGSD